MDAGAQGAVIGIGVMVFFSIVCLVRERCQQKTLNEHTNLVKKEEPILVRRFLSKKQTSMRDFYRQNVPSSSKLREIQIS